jgi:hypothetical protein
MPKNRVVKFSFLPVSCQAAKLLTGLVTQSPLSGSRPLTGLFYRIPPTLTGYTENFRLSRPLILTQNISNDSSVII